MLKQCHEADATYLSSIYLLLVIYFHFDERKILKRRWYESNDSWTYPMELETDWFLSLATLSTKLTLGWLFVELCTKCLWSFVSNSLRNYWWKNICVTYNWEQSLLLQRNMLSCLNFSCFYFLKKSLLTDCWLLWMQSHAEVDTFCCFVELLSMFRDNFCKQLDNSLVGIRSTIEKLSQLLKRHDEELWRQLEVTTKVRFFFCKFWSFLWFY